MFNEWTVAGVENANLEFRYVREVDMPGIIWQVYEAHDTASGDDVMCYRDPDKVEPNQYFWRRPGGAWNRMF